MELKQNLQLILQIHKSEKIGSLYTENSDMRSLKFWPQNGIKILSIQKT